MAEIITREALYQLVWRVRLRDLVSRFGLSEPTLRKRCREKEIPLPGPGHWTRLSDGKAHVPPLPARGPGMDELISFAIGPESPVRRPLNEEELLGPIPDAPVFNEPLEDIRTRYLEKVCAPKVARDLNRAHHRIRRLLSEDDGRRELQKRRGYFSAYDGPKFDTPFEQRRLRILNALMLETAKAGGEIKIWDQAARSINVKIHDTTLSLAFDHQKRLDERYYSQHEPPPAETPLHLILRKNWSASSEIARWSDGAEPTLEMMIGPIVAEFFVQAEACYRRTREWEHSHRIERKAARIEEIRRSKEKLEQEQRAEQARLQRERVERLLQLADDHRKAEAIRSFASAVERVLSTDPRVLNWKNWALGVADDLDPVGPSLFEDGESG